MSDVPGPLNGGMPTYELALRSGDTVAVEFPHDAYPCQARSQHARHSTCLVCSCHCASAAKSARLTCQQQLVYMQRVLEALSEARALRMLRSAPLPSKRGAETDALLAHALTLKSAAAAAA